MILPCSALFDPPNQQVDLFLGQWALEFAWRHALVSVVRRHSAHEFTFFRVSRHDNRSAVGKYRFAQIQTKVGLQTLGVGSVTLVAVVGENGLDVSSEINRIVCGLGRHRGR